MPRPYTFQGGRSSARSKAARSSTGNEVRRRAGVEPSPDLCSVLRRRERVEESHLAARLDARRRDHPFPAEPGLPVRMFVAPDPKAWRHVSQFVPHLA